MTIQDRWAALQFDQAVTTFGLIIENASQEQIQTGDKWVNKYTLEQLLTPGFVLDSDEREGDALPMHADGLVYDEVDGAPV